MRKFYILFLILSLPIFLTACKIFPTAKTTKPEESPISGPLLAQVDDWKIGLDDFEKSLKTLEPLISEQNIKIDYEFKVKVLDELVRNAILAQEAKRRGLEQDRDVVEVVKRYKQTILAEKLKNDLTKDIYVTDAEVEEFYKKNKEFFKGLPEFKVREIVVDSQSKANELSVRLLQGEDFVSLAQGNSVVESAKKGGDLGYISYDPTKKFDKFWGTIAVLDEGNISNPFKGSDGKYYILKVEAKREGEIIPLAKIRDELKKRLEEDKKQRKTEEVVSSAKQRAKVVLNPDLLK